MRELTLKHFILKQQALNLYRQAIRASRSIPDKSARTETVAWIRSEFERNRNIYDVRTRYLLVGESSDKYCLAFMYRHQDDNKLRPELSLHTPALPVSPPIAVDSANSSELGLLRPPLLPVSSSQPGKRRPELSARAYLQGRIWFVTVLR
ncbi:hypothetical protein FKP32DRAFT_770636 [Trametes sanguinea]|nr:hypothetical protein FKP32DRAFT_770636 [Trametes sanguinea]